MGDFSYILIGLGVGLMVGMTGVGGGSLMTPILIFTGLSPSVAVGTDLVYSAVNKSAGAWVHWRQKTVNFEIVKWLSSGSLPAALITTIVVTYVLTQAKAYTQGAITYALAAVLIFVSLAMLVKPWIAKRLSAFSVTQGRRLATSVGVLVGVLVALTSVGGGSLTMVALMLLMREAATSELVGTDVFHAALLSIVAATARSVSTIFVGHSVDFTVAGILLIGSLPGVYVGSRMSVKLPDQVMRFGLSGALMAVTWRLLS